MSALFDAANPTGIPSILPDATGYYGMPTKPGIYGVLSSRQSRLGYLVVCHSESSDQMTSIFFLGADWHAHAFPADAQGRVWANAVVSAANFGKATEESDSPAWPPDAPEPVRADTPPAAPNDSLVVCYPVLSIFQPGYGAVYTEAQAQVVAQAFQANQAKEERHILQMVTEGGYRIIDVKTDGFNECGLFLVMLTVRLDPPPPF